MEQGLFLRHGFESMFERFTEKCIKAIMLAQEESRQLGHNFVGTEQILLGLLGEGTGIAAKTLKHFGVTVKDTRVEVEKIIGRGSGFVAVEIPFTPRAKRTLELAWEEARQLGHKYIGTEHLLLAITRESEGEGVASRVLEILKVNPPDVRTHVMKMLTGEQQPEKSEPSERQSEQTEAQPAVSENPKRMWGSPETCCPNCAERISKGAITCRHCGFGLSDEHYVECKFCKERIRKEAIKCKFCLSMLNDS